MPWCETTPMEQRLEFVQEYKSGLFTMTELAAEYGISRKTGYKWLAQYAAEGALGCRTGRGGRITTRRRSMRSCGTRSSRFAVGIRDGGRRSC